MTREEILNKAVYIQYPISPTDYKDYNINVDIYKMPINNDLMYHKWQFNGNHFTTEYHRLYSLPAIANLLNIEYTESDFSLIKNYYKEFDISMLYPKKDFIYEIYGYTKNEHFDNLKYDDLINCPLNGDYGITQYHMLYRYPHQCSRLINKTINSDRKLLISGDSHMIPNISVLSCYFKEIYYFDNRNNIQIKKYIENVEFTHVLIELNYLSLEQYIYTNIC